MIRIHITGAPGSGKTLLHSLVSECFANIQAPDHDVRLWGRAPREGFVCTKAEKDTPHVPAILPLDKSLHVVCMVRDPRDFVCCRDHSNPDRYYTNLRQWRAKARILRKMRDQPRFNLVRYEDLFTRPDEVQKALAKRMSFLVRCAPFSSSAALEAAKARAPGAWRDNMGRVKQQIKLHGSIDEDLIDFSYEKNSGWMEELHYIERDETPSAAPERRPALFDWTAAALRPLAVTAYLSRRITGL